jgi:hypothetical protein
MASQPISQFGFSLDLDTTDVTALLKPVPSATPEQRKRRDGAGNSLAHNFMMLSPLTLLAACGGGGGGGGVTPPPPPPPPPPAATFALGNDSIAVTAPGAVNAAATLFANDTLGGSAVPAGTFISSVTGGGSSGSFTSTTSINATTNLAGGSLGTLTFNPSTGVWGFTGGAGYNALGAGATGSATYTYQLTNGTTSSTTGGTITINATGVNDAPTPTADTIGAAVGGAVVTASTRATGLLGNDTDPDSGQTATITVTAVGAGTAAPTGGVGTAITGSAGGRLTVAADGTYTYTPPATGSGSETFTYVVSDGTLTASTTVTVNLSGTLGSTISLTGLNGTNGFAVTGGPAGVGAELGASVAVGTGVTGSGNSIVIGAPGVGTDAGRVYVITGTGSTTATLNLGSAAGVVQINGAAANDRAGTSVDVGGLNADALGDILIGAPGTNGNQGTGYVVFGAATPGTTLGGLTATQGFTTVGLGNGGGAYSGQDTTGAQTGDNLGYLARYLGSINGDANADFLFALPGYDIGGQASGNDSGAAIIGYGSNFANRTFGDFLSSTTVTGFIATIDGNNGLDENAISDAAAGNLNEANGTATTRDLIISAARFDVNPGGGGAIRVDGGRVNVIFSSTNPQGGTFDGAALNGNTGYVVLGSAASDFLGTAVAAGDLNGDGIGDLVIGAPGADANGSNSGAIYIVYGQTAALTNAGTPGGGVIDLALLTSSTGLINGATVVRVAGGAASQGFGSDLAVGDFNGDGRADIAVGSDTTGDAWIIFGRGATNMALVNVATPAAGNVVLIDGPAASGTNYRLSLDAGSVNGDGFADLVIGATADNADGAVYVVYGANAGGQVPTSLGAILADAPNSVDSIIDAAVGGLGGQRSGGFAVSIDAPIQVGADFAGLEDISSALHINAA